MVGVNLMVETKQIVEYGEKLLSFFDDLLKVADARHLKDEQNWKKIFLYFSLNEARSSFKIFVTILKQSNDDILFMTPLSVIARNIYEIFLTLYWVAMENIENIYFAHSAREDKNLYNIHEEINKSKNQPIVDGKIKKALDDNLKYFEAMIKKAEKVGKRIISARGNDLLKPSEIATHLEEGSKDPFFKTMKIGHKSYYKLLCLTSHFRPSTATANIPHISDSKILETTKNMFVQTTFRTILMITEKGAKKVSYLKKDKNKQKELESEYEELFKNYF